MTNVWDVYVLAIANSGHTVFVFVQVHVHVYTSKRSIILCS